MQELNPAIPMGHMAASVPPAMATSTRPRRIISAASPIESAPVAQADTTEKFGPLIPNIIDTCPDAISPSIIGTVNGLTRRGPRVAKLFICSVIVRKPPTPLPISTATLEVSTS